MVVLSFLQAHWGVLATGLFFISEALALIPGVKANSIFQLVFGFLQKAQSSSSSSGTNPPSA